MTPPTDRGPSEVPTDITVHTASRALELTYAGGRRVRLSFEFLRVFSPSAEVRGHGPGQEQLQVGKRAVTIESLEPVGHYGIRPRFSDGHDTGIFSWDYLDEIGRDPQKLWAEYLGRLAAAGASREPGDPANARYEAAATAPAHSHRH